MVIGIHQTMTLLQVEDLVNLSCKYQTVATHDEIVVGNRRCDIVVVYDLNQAATMYVVQTSLSDGLADLRTVGWH